MKPYEHPPLKHDKGKFGGSCNRRACQAPGATWWNVGTRAYYCEECARAINRACADYEHGPICLPEKPVRQGGVT